MILEYCSIKPTRQLVLTCVLFLTLLLGVGRPQFLPVGSRSMALGGQKTLLADRAGTVFYNPSLLAGLPTLSLWLNSYRPFGLAEVKMQALALNYASKRAGFAMGFSNFGDDIYKQEQFVGAAGYRISKGLRGGVKLNTYKTAIAGYGASTEISFDAGGDFQVVPAITVGLLLTNLKMGRARAIAEREIHFATRINMSGENALFIEVQKLAHFRRELQVAFELSPMPNFSILAGAGLNTPSQFSAGFSLHFASLQADYALQSHPALQQTHIFTLSFEVKK